MAQTGDCYDVIVKESHIDWGLYRHPTNRGAVAGESYVKIPSEAARNFYIVRGTHYTAHFVSDILSFKIKAAGNGPRNNGVQYAKQFEGIGLGACKAFTPWYISCNIQVGDIIHVEFISPNDIKFSKI